MGSNMAENHPVGFQWVVEAQRRGGKLIHVDPRFTRTSALADVHVPLRAGTDIAFLGGLINHVLTHGREFREYVVAYSNAATIVSEDFADTEDLGGYFSGWDPDEAEYSHDSWSYEGMHPKSAAGDRMSGGTASGDDDGEARNSGHDGEEEGGGESEEAGALGGDEGGGVPPRDPTLTHPRCVFQLLKRHFGRYTPEMVARTCGVSEERFLEVAELLCANSGRERTGSICYAVAWTQHSVGVQMIRAASILQTLLGNIGRPGGGIMALRGHASIQGSTDIPTLFDLLPGYIPMPTAATGGSLDDFIDAAAGDGGHWAQLRAYTVSLLKAWFGDAATADDDFCFHHLPRLTGDHSTYETVRAMLEGDVIGYFTMGENPAVGSANSGMHRLALAELEWLVVRDFHEIETAAFWYDSPEVDSGQLRTEAIATEVFLMPAAAHTEKDGTFTQTQRLLQWHSKAVEPAGERRSELWFAYHLGRMVRERLAGSTDDRDRPILDLTWSYPTEGDHEEPDAEAVLREINGWDAAGAPLSSYTQLRDDGSTACGCWIYCGCFADGVNQTARKKPWREQDVVALEWAWAWPANRRILYNRASADPEGRPWSERKRHVWWDDEQARWVGDDVPDIDEGKHPSYRPTGGATGPDALGGADPFIMQSDGKAWLFAPAGLADGPFPTHYEPTDSPVRNPLHHRQDSPAAKHVESPENPANGRVRPDAPPEGGERFPYVLTSFRLTEHHTAGAMSRTFGVLSELQPEMFCEVSPQLALECGLVHGGWATIVNARGAIEAKVMVTERVQPLVVDGRELHQVCVPYHWGRKGESTGDSANDLFGMTVDPNVFIQDTKSTTCDVLPGRCPPGPQRRNLVLRYRAAAAPEPEESRR